MIIYKVEEAGAILRYGRTLMYKLIKDGEIESIKEGKLRRVPDYAIEEYIAKKRAAQAVKAAG